MTEQKLQVWWIPQFQMKPFEISVSTVEEGLKILDVLADYDKFQFENNIKPDYCNAGGLQVWDENSDRGGNPGWVDYDEDILEERMIENG